MSTPAKDEREALRSLLRRTILRGRTSPPVCQLVVSGPTAATHHFSAYGDDISWSRVGIRVNDDVDDSQCHFTLLLAKRKDVHPLAKLPVVLVLHYTSSSCEHEEMVAVKARFARCGFLAVGLDTRYLGCRAAPGSKLKADYLASLVRAWKQNQPHRPEGSIFPFIYDTVGDLYSVADYLTSREDVDSSRLGITGISLGGMHAWFAAAADTRWSAAAPLIGVQSFSYAIDTGCYEPRVASIQAVFDAAAADMDTPHITREVVRAVWARICPGLLESFDGGRAISLVSPRHFFIASGADDLRCPLRGVQDAVAVARRAFKRDGREERLVLKAYPGVEHVVTGEMWDDCVEFFERVFDVQCDGLKVD